MNVQGLKQTIVTKTPCVTTPKDLTSVTALADIMVMVETAQVNISFFCIVLACYILFNPLTGNRTNSYEKHQQWFENLQLSQTWRYDSNNLLLRQSDKF